MRFLQIILQLKRYILFSLFIFNIYAIQKVILENKIGNIIFYSFTAALLINAKILGIIPFLIFIIMYSIYLFEVNKNISKNIKYIFFILGLTFIFIIILWPYLWFDPINNFIKAFTDIIAAHNNLSVITLFNGEYITSTNTPWFYRILWFYITIPVIVGIFFTIGFSL